MGIARTILICAVLVLKDGNLQTVLAQNCSADLQKLGHPYIVHVGENTLAGSVIANITTYGGIEYDNRTAISPFIEILDWGIVTSMDIFLDGPNNTDSCKKAIQSQPTHRIWCKDNKNTEVDVYVLLDLTDDYGPSFTSSETSVSESTKVGTRVLKLDNITIDEDCANQFVYSIDANQFFHVDNNEKSLILNHELDFEVQTVYQIKLQVSSHVENTDYKNANINLTVRVNDVDDMSPVFDISQFVLHVPEEQNVSSIWYTASPPVLARDGDVGINTTIVYNLENTAGLRLDIQNLTGDVNVMDILDRERQSTYKVVVKAAQADLSYRTATAILSILVDDVNDNRPVYTSQNSVTIMEDAPTGSDVIKLTGEDIDEGLNSQFDFVIGSDAIGAFGLFTSPATNKTYLIVKNNIALRGLSYTSVEIQLVEKQSPFPGSRSCDYINNCVGNITIYITDVNDNTPVFNANSYNFTVASNVSGHIGQVQATDADKGDNAKIVYSLSFIASPRECTNIKMDPTNGELSTGQTLPAGVVCPGIVTACDSPADIQSKRCAFVLVSVTVIFSGTVLEQDVHVMENVPVGTMVTPISIKGLHTTSTYFEITNDVLYTKVQLDRETKDKYDVQILSGLSTNSSNVMIIHVHIDDVNDNAPVFDHPLYVLKNLDDTVQLNHTVLHVNASDADIGDNSRLAFSLVSGTEYIDIDSRTGEIWLINFPTKDIECQLVVTDFGHPPLKGYSTLRVYTPLHNETATVILPVAKNELMADRDGVAAKLSSVLGVIVRIFNIESLGPVPDVGSKLYIGATTAGGQPVSPTDLSQLLEQHAVEIYQKFAKSASDSKDSKSDVLSVLEIVLICVSGVLLLAVIIFLTLWCRSKNKFKRSKRLFDSLNRNTVMYDNPRKPSNTSAAVTNNNESTNAQKMLARLSNGSVGNNSVTNLLPKLSSGSNSGTTTPPNGDIPEQDVHNYVNAAHFARASPLAGADGQDDETDLIPPSLTTSDLLHNQHVGILRESSPNSQPNDNTSSSAGQISGASMDPDSGVTSHMGNNVEVDETDQEVAHILSDNIPKDGTPEDNRSNLDLMTALTHPAPAETFLNSNYNNTPATSNQHGLDVNTLPEPEPDYAKKVRFNDTTTAVETNKVLDHEDNEDKNTSLEQFLSYPEDNSDSEPAPIHSFDDTIEELTAL